MRFSASSILDQLARAVAGAQFQRAFRFDGRTVGDIGLDDAALLQGLQGFVGFLEQFGPPFQELPAEVLQHDRIHEILVFLGIIIWRNSNGHFLVVSPG